MSGGWSGGERTDWWTAVACLNTAVTKMDGEVSRGTVCTGRLLPQLHSRLLSIKQSHITKLSPNSSLFKGLDLAKLLKASINCSIESWIMGSNLPKKAKKIL